MVARVGKMGANFAQSAPLHHGAAAAATAQRMGQRVG